MSEISELFARCVKLHQAGERSVAAQGYAAILNADPGHADAWHLSGVLAHQSGRSADAIDFLRRAIELVPGKAEYRSNLAAVLMAVNQWDGALKEAEAAIAADPKLAAAWVQKGRILAHIGQAENACLAFQTSREMGFDAALVLHEIGMVRQSMGDLSGCIASLEESLRLNSAQPAIWLTLSRLVTTRQYQFSERHLELMRDALKNTPAEKDKARIAFALAAHFDVQGDYDAAFGYLQAGNQHSRTHLHGKGVNYDPQKRSRLADDIIEVFNDAFLKGLEPVSQSSRPIVVVGMPRSGTSLVEQILASHPDVVGGGELAWWPSTMRPLFYSPDPKQQLKSLTAEWRHRTALGYEQVLQSISADSARVVDKLPGNYLHLGIIASAFPKATIIHCCRDPRDTCLSGFAQLFDDDQLQLATSDFDSLARRYQDYERLMQHWHAVLPGRILDVHYELLTQDPDFQIRRMINAAGLNWSDSCMKFHEVRRIVHTASVTQVRQPLYKSSGGKWRRYEHHLHSIQSVLAPTVERYEKAIRNSDRNATPSDSSPDLLASDG